MCSVQEGRKEGMKGKERKEGERKKRRKGRKGEREGGKERGRDERKGRKGKGGRRKGGKEGERKEGNKSNVHTYSHTRIAVTFESWSAHWSPRALGTLGKFQHQEIS